MVARKNAVKKTVVSLPEQKPQTAEVVVIADGVPHVTVQARAKITSASVTDAKSRTQWLDAAQELFAGSIRPEHLDFGTNKKHGPLYDEAIYAEVKGLCVVGVSMNRGKVRVEVAHPSKPGRRIMHAFTYAEMVGTSEADYKRMRPSADWGTVFEGCNNTVNAQIGRIKMYLTREWARFEPDRYKTAKKDKKDAGTVDNSGATDASEIHRFKRELLNMDARFSVAKDANERLFDSADIAEGKKMIAALLAIIGKRIG